MPAFSSKPRPQSPSEAERAAFVREPEAPLGVKPAGPPPWAGLDPDAPRLRSLSLRLNDYELERLRHAAKRGRRSLQQTVHAALAELLEQRDGEPP